MKFISILAAVMLLLLASPVLATSLGVSPSYTELEVPGDGSAAANFQVHYFSGDLEVNLVDIPLRVEPETFHIEPSSEPVEIELTIYGNESLGSRVYDGYVRFLGMSGETVGVAVKVKAKVTNLVEGEPLVLPSDGDTTPPSISGIYCSGVTEATADICWNTNEESTSQVEYRTSPGKLSPLDKTYVLNHLVHLTGLAPGTTYHCKAMSRDRAGNLGISDELTFTTLIEPVPESTPPVPDLAPPPTPTSIPPLSTPAVPQWLLIGSIVVVLAVLIGSGYWLWQRRR